MKLLLNPWGPWKQNPSVPENFYDINESFKEEELEDLNEEVIDENESEIKDSVNEEIMDPESINSLESEDPYASILKDIK